MEPDRVMAVGISATRPQEPDGRRPSAVQPASEVALRIEGQRLRQLCRASLRITCACGHEGTLAVASLLDRHPRDTRLRDALASVRCSRCQLARIERVQRQD